MYFCEYLTNFSGCCIWRCKSCWCESLYLVNWLARARLTCKGNWCWLINIFIFIKSKLINKYHHLTPIYAPSPPRKKDTRISRFTRSICSPASRPDAPSWMLWIQVTTCFCPILNGSHRRLRILTWISQEHPCLPAIHWKWQANVCWNFINICFDRCSLPLPARKEYICQLWAWYRWNRETLKEREVQRRWLVNFCWESLRKDCFGCNYCILWSSK